MKYKGLIFIFLSVAFCACSKKIYVEPIAPTVSQPPVTTLVNEEPPQQMPVEKVNASSLNYMYYNGLGKGDSYQIHLSQNGEATLIKHAEASKIKLGERRILPLIKFADTCLASDASLIDPIDSDVGLPMHNIKVADQEKSYGFHYSECSKILVQELSDLYTEISK